MKCISFVIPCYNSELTIEKVVADIDANFKGNERYEYEIVLVNDGSPKDNTWGKIRELSEKNERVKALNLSKNFGQDAALLAGYSQAKGEYIVSLDDDGQNPAKEAWKLLDTAEEGKWDIVFGKYHKKKHSLIKNFGSALNDRVATWMLGKPKHIRLCSYYLMTDFVKKELIKDFNNFPYIWGRLLRITSNITNVYIEHDAREIGESNFTLWKSIKLFLNGFVGFSIVPLRISSIIGMLVAVAGFLEGIIIVLRTLLLGEQVEGWTSLMVVILILGGLVLVMIGLLGEYIGRINVNVIGTDAFIIREISDGDTSK